MSARSAPGDLIVVQRIGGDEGVFQSELPIDQQGADLTELALSSSSRPRGV